MAYRRRGGHLRHKWTSFHRDLRHTAVLAEHRMSNQTCHLALHHQHQNGTAGFQHLHRLIVIRIHHDNSIDLEHFIAYFQAGQVCGSRFGDPWYEDAVIVALEGGWSFASGNT